MTIRNLLNSIGDNNLTEVSRKAQSEGLELRAQTVQKWAYRGRIPYPWQDHVVRWAKNVGVDISVDEVRQMGRQS